MKTEISRYERDFPPATYLLKIESYSLLSQSRKPQIGCIFEAGGIKRPEKYDSRIFEAGGYKWRLSLYPNGDKKNNGDGYISLYLAIVDTNLSGQHVGVNVNFKLFVYDQIKDKYLTIEDADGAIKRFNVIKKEWGFAQLLSLETFNDSSNGYLVNDSCAFGVEIFVINYTGMCESLSMVKKLRDHTFTWKIKNFSKLKKDLYYSRAFNVGGINWKLLIYPNGIDHKNVKNISFSFYIALEDIGSHPNEGEVYAKCNLKVVDQVKGKHVASQVLEWFKILEDDTYEAVGFAKFMSLKHLREISNGFIVNDTLIVEAVFLATSMTEVKIS